MRLGGARAALLALCLAPAGCVANDVGPINTVEASLERPSPVSIPDPGDDGSTVVGLAFSGGGTRAAAFAYGVLRELGDTVIDEKPRRRSLLDDVRMVSGASGGAVAAAYFGYKGRDGYQDFRERFLTQDAEAYLGKSFSPLNLVRAYNGGVNDRNTFARWLNEKVFDGATYQTLRQGDRPFVWINASDIYNGVPFLFTYDTFAALCSNLDKLRISDAVAASAAVPVVFTPVVVDARRHDCRYTRPEWLTRALEDPEAPLRLKAYARALEAYREVDDLRYVKLLDGGLTDNIGVTAFAVRRAASDNPYAPLSAQEAIRLRTLIFIVADAGRREPVIWARNISGPRIGPLLSAVVDTGMTAAVRSEFDALKLETDNWRNQLVRYRCSLPLSAIVKARGSLAGWDCHDVTLVLERLSFGSLGAQERAKLNEIPTRLHLPPDQVDMAIQAGREAFRSNPMLQRAVCQARLRAGLPAGAPSDGSVVRLRNSWCQEQGKRRRREVALSEPSAD
jgi:predicted acylesterase/phospholipase RssA